MRSLARLRNVLSAAVLLGTSGMVLPHAEAAAASRGDGPTGSMATAAVCPMSALATPPGALRAEVADSDPTGRFQVGHVLDKALTYRLVRWENGVLEDLGGGHSGASGINVHGDVVGHGSGDAGESMGWLYRGGQFSRLPGLNAGANGFPWSINAAGTVVGSSRGSAGFLPVLWLPDGSVRQLVLPPGHTEGQARDVDDDGTVVGWTGNRSATHAVRWLPDGTVEQLPTLPSGSTRSGGAFSVRGGHVIGQETTGQGPVSMVLWRKGAGSAQFLGEGDMQAVNALGAVVVRPTPEVKLRLIEPDGTVRSLPTDSTPYPTGKAVALSDDGVAYGSWNSTPVSWDCRASRIG